MAVNNSSEFYISGINSTLVKLRKINADKWNDKSLKPYMDAMKSSSRSKLIQAYRDIRKDEVIKSELDTYDLVNIKTEKENADSAKAAADKVNKVKTDLDEPRETMAGRKAIASPYMQMADEYSYDSLALRRVVDKYITLPEGNQYYDTSISRDAIITGRKKEMIARIRITDKRDKSTQRTSDFVKFFLTNVEESSTEKYQLIETFGENILAMYGKRPLITSFSGVLLNTEGNPWRDDFYRYYNNYLRGSKCAESKSIAHVIYEGRVVEGYVLSMSIGMAAGTDRVCPFSFSVFVTDVAMIGS